ncbi:uncharacterized protein [Argopecten irradians]|uniref:uncharacterized protein isoform X1 n=1 Tax=Argopecten irradians TaxID=31199 RepID=UPI00372017E1
MESIQRLVRSQTFSNWLDVAIGISITTTGISDYIKGTIRSLHDEIKYTEPCVRLPNCSSDCSKTEQNLSKWCPTCMEWKKQIMKHNRYNNRARNIKWKRISSKEWPHDVNEMVKVFAPEWETTMPYNEDLSVALHVIHNCKKFNIPIPVYNRVRDIRNTNAHGERRASITEKNQALNGLLKFLKRPEIASTKSGKKAISKLNKLKSTSALKLATTDVSIKRRLVQVSNSQPDIKDILIATLGGMDAKEKSLTDKIAKYKSILHTILIIVHVLLLLHVYDIHNQVNSKDLSNTNIYKDKDCLPLVLSKPCPWQADFPFDGYLNDLPVLYGRQWLVDKIQTSLIGTSSRGILLTAEMGYGKSMLVAKLLCSSKLALRKFILSYHICKFDVISTQRPEYFIKTLAGMLISHIPVAGNAILTNELGMKFLETGKCSEDPIGCLDAAIIHPLRGLEFDEERYVIIDAIDECGDSAAIAISLLDVLSKRISKMPWWLKFFVTARDINKVTEKFSQMNIFHESTNNVRNQDDISTFLAHHLYTHTTTLSRLFGSHIDLEKATKQILVISGSNFLHVDLAVRFWIDYSNSKVTDIPHSLSELYNANLERVFGDNLQKYDLARKVFEVLCTSNRKPTLDELKDIVHVTMHPYDLIGFLGNQMSHFVDGSSAYIRVRHKGICDHLSNETSVFSKYRISTQNGHKMFAMYLIDKHNLSRTDTLDMLIHVAESNDLDIKHLFKDSQHFVEMKLSASQYLHQMSKTKNSYLGTKLLIKILGKELINAFTSANVTASFLAAAFGHSETLRALLDEGEDYFFRVSDPPNKGGFEDAVNHCKYKTLWGYGLLDIAAQNGHLDVVNLLLSKNKSLLYMKNGLNLTPVHLASEHGHTDILDTFLAIDNTLADQHALYLASKNGHVGCVLALLQHGAEDTCIPCEDAMPWITDNTKRMQWDPCSYTSEDCTGVLLSRYDDLGEVTFVLYDDEYLIKCSTALEVAIQRGNTEVVVHLLSQAINGLACREHGGRSPILTAIKYNQSEILDVIVRKHGILNEKCTRAYNSTARLSVEILHINEKKKLMDDMCPLGAGVEHFLAMYGRIELFLYLKYHGISFDWTQRDEVGNTPFHYAACNNTWRMIQYMIIVEKVDIYVSARNGSLPIHSAVICNAIMSYVALRQFYAESNKELIDNEGRGLFHYLALATKFAKDVDQISLMFIIKNNTFMIKTSVKDANYSTYLHYAAAEGHYNILMYRSDISLLLETNNMNKNVIDVAFDNLPHNGEYRTCVGCSLVDLWTRQLKFEYDKVLSKEEMVIYRIFQVIHVYPETQRRVDFHKYHTLAVMKGNAFILLSIILFQPRPQDFLIDKHLLRTFFSTERPPIGMLYLLSQYTVSYCDQSFEDSLLHKTIRNENNKYWIYWVYGDEFVIVLRQKPAAFWDSCYDSDGANLLQHAVMGGNSLAVRFLIDYGMTFIWPPPHSVDLISLGVSHAKIYPINKIRSRAWMKYVTHTYFYDQIISDRDIFENNFYSSTQNFDKATLYVLSNVLKLGNMTLSDVCKTHSKQLSLVHRFAIKGHVLVLEALHEAFGKNVLQCKNVYKFTPLYFAKLFDHSDVIRFFESKSISVVYPHKRAEFAFLQIMATDDLSEPAYVDFMIRLTHPYIYQLKSLHRPVVRRTLQKLCFDSIRLFESFDVTDIVKNRFFHYLNILTGCNKSLIIGNSSRWHDHIKHLFSLCRTVKHILYGIHRFFYQFEYYLSLSAFHDDRNKLIIKTYPIKLSFQNIKTPLRISKKVCKRNRGKSLSVYS